MHHKCKRIIVVGMGLGVPQAIGGAIEKRLTNHSADVYVVDGAHFMRYRDTVTPDLVICAGYHLGEIDAENIVRTFPDDSVIVVHDSRTRGLAEALNVTAIDRKGGMDPILEAIGEAFS